MTDKVGFTLILSPHVVGRTVPGAPPLDDRRRRLHAPPHLRACPCVADVRRDRLQLRFSRCARQCPPPHVFDPAGTARAPFFTGVLRYPSTHAGRAWKPAPTVGIRISPTLHQPLSHGAARRDSSPFRGAEGWEEVCGVYATIYHDADTYVYHPPVRGGVPDAPRSRDCRGGVVAGVRRDRFYPRFLRCAR